MNSSSSRRDNDSAGHGAPPGATEVAWTTHVSIDTQLLERLFIRHRERHRRYHRIEHVEAVLGYIDELATEESIDDLGAVVAAALYHDAIYESQHPANERASARLAQRDLMMLGWKPSRASLVGTMIEGTKTHLDPPDIGTAVLFDADLAILGADHAGYQSYTSKVRDEYGHLGTSEWVAGRASVLTAFLERQMIYATTTGRERWEEAARANITAELTELTV